MAAAPRAGTRQRPGSGPPSGGPGRGDAHAGRKRRARPPPQPRGGSSGPHCNSRGSGGQQNWDQRRGSRRWRRGQGISGQASKPYQVSLSGEGTPAGPEMVEAEPTRRAAVVGWGPPSVGGGPWDPTTPLQPTPLKTRGTAQEFLEHAARDSIALEPSESEAMPLWPQQGPLQCEDNHPGRSGCFEVCYKAAEGGAGSRGEGGEVGVRGPHKTQDVPRVSGAGH